MVLGLIGRFLIEEKSQGGKTIKETKEKRIQVIQKEINIIQGQRENIINAIAAGIPIEEVKDKLQELSREKEKLFKDKEKIKEQVNNLNNLKIHQGFIEIKEILPNLKPAELKELYKNLIRVEFHILEKTGKLTLLLEPPHEPIIKDFTLFLL